MSNKLRNKFVKFLLLLIFIYSAVELTGYEPEVEDFANTFQYKLYRSWLIKGGFKTNFPAGFGNDKIVKSFLDKQGKSIQVEYDWINRKITDQRESLPVIFFVEDFSKIKPFLNFLEGLIYRFNTVEFEFLEEYLDFDQIQIDYNNKKGIEAVKSIWQTYQHRRIEIDPLELEVLDKSLIFYLPLKSDEVIIIKFPIEYDMAVSLQNIRIKEREKSHPLVEDEIDDYASVDYLEEDVAAIKRKPDIIDKTRKTLPDLELQLLPEIDTLTLAEYVDSYYSVRQSKELLHNKISDPVEFLISEFPGREIQEANGIISVTAPKYRNDFGCEIIVNLEQNKDGINFSPLMQYKVHENMVVFGHDEKVMLNFLNKDERDSIAPFIAQLAYEHRAIGSRLLNFLLIHDNIPTTLIMRDGSRKVYELNSYANLLLMLGNYWQSHHIYFKVQEVAKKNGHIELQSYLIALDNNQQEADMAEILFHLDDEYKIDMILMILHQGNDREEG